jgi:hypothetical protein
MDDIGNIVDGADSGDRYRVALQVASIAQIRRTETGTIREIVQCKEHGVQLQLKARAQLAGKSKVLIHIPACWDEMQETNKPIHGSEGKRSNQGNGAVDTNSTDEPGTSNGSMDGTRNINAESTDDSGNGSDESMDGTRNRAESTDDSGSGDTEDIGKDNLFHTEMTELETVFRKVSMAKTVQKGATIDGKTARRLATSTRPVLLKLRAAVGRANQDLRSLVQHKKEATQQEIQQLKQQKEEEIMEQVYEKVTDKFFEQHQAYKEEIQSLKQIITEQEASIQHHQKWCKK